MKEAVGLFATGTGAATAGIWAILQNATTFFACVAAFCGAVTGLFGLYLMFRKICRNQYEKSTTSSGIDIND